MANPLKNVSITDLINIHVFVGTPKPDDLLPYQVIVEPIDHSKKVVFDEDALKVLNQRVTEKAQQFENGTDPRVIEYIKEFVARMMEVLHKNGLVDLIDIPDAEEDPYAFARQMKMPPR